MKFLSLFKPKQSLVLLVDIGSSSVGAAYAYIEAGKPVRIVATERKELVFLESLSSKSFLIAMNHALASTLKAIHKKALGVPDHILATLSTPWLFVKTFHVARSYPVPTRITERLIADLIDEEIDALRKDSLSNLPQEDIHIVEKNILGIKLNGYEVENPYGKKSRGVDITCAVAISSKKVIEGVTRQIAHMYHTSTLRLASFPLVGFSAVRDMYPETEHFLFVDITGESTDVTVVQHGLLKDSTSFSLGKNFFLRKLVLANKSTHQEAASLLRMFYEERLTSSAALKVGETLHTAQDEWRARLEKAVHKIAGDAGAPEAIFFSCDSDIAPLFESLIHSAHLSLAPRYTPAAHFFDQFTTSRFIGFESGVERDPFLGVEALLAKKINLL